MILNQSLCQALAEAYRTVRRIASQAMSSARSSVMSISCPGLLAITLMVQCAVANPTRCAPQSLRVHPSVQFCALILQCAEASLPGVQPTPLRTFLVCKFALAI